MNLHKKFEMKILSRADFNLLVDDEMWANSEISVFRWKWTEKKEEYAPSKLIEISFYAKWFFWHKESLKCIITGCCQKLISRSISDRIDEENFEMEGYNGKGLKGRANFGKMIKTETYFGEYEKWEYVLVNCP